MTTRLLPPSEWDRLDGTELHQVWRDFAPDGLSILVVEDGAEIVACWGLMPVWHVEGVWIHPEHRGKASVARRLLAGMRELLAEQQIVGVVTAAADAEIVDYVTRLGATPLPPSFAWRVH